MSEFKNMIVTDDLETEILHKRFYQNMAYAVMVKLSIKNDRSLVSFIGDGYERSNHQAIFFWILDRYDIELFEDLDLGIDEVSQALYEYLENQINNGDISC